jgi:hypothetical protein
MSDIGTLIDLLIAAGTPPGLAAQTIAQAFVAGAQCAPDRERSSAAIRQARYRSKKAGEETVTNRNESVTSVTVTSPVTDPSPPKEVSPYNPLQEITPPSHAALSRAAVAAPVDLETDLYRRGKEVLGKTAGGLVRQLLTAKGGKITDARAAIETAAGKQDPREYIGAILRNHDPPHGEASRYVDPRL